MDEQSVCNSIPITKFQSSRLGNPSKKKNDEGMNKAMEDL
jgi:hypothetical protein